MSPADSPIHLRARYDGRALILEGPLDLPEGIVLELRGEPVASQERPRRKAGSAKGLISMRDDFDDPLEEFAEYM